MKVILQLMRFSFGHATLTRCFALDNLVFKLLHANESGILSETRVSRESYQEKLRD